MGELVTRTLVRCPVSQAGYRLSAFLRQHGDDGDVALLPLAVDLAYFAPTEGARFEKNAIVTIAPLSRPQATFPSYEIGWSPEHGGPYPTFRGRLEIEADDDYNSFFLKLSGGYEPPQGLAGALFDATIGQKIAKTVVTELLVEIATHVENAFRQSEREKLGRRHLVAEPDT